MRPYKFSLQLNEDEFDLMWLKAGRGVQDPEVSDMERGMWQRVDNNLRGAYLTEYGVRLIRTELVCAHCKQKFPGGAPHHYNLTTLTDSRDKYPPPHALNASTNADCPGINSYGLWQEVPDVT